MIEAAKYQAYIELEVYHIHKLLASFRFKSMSGFQNLEHLKEWVLNVNILLFLSLQKLDSRRKEV